jgi:hypothetical protein
VREAADLVLVTSQAWCDRLAKGLLEMKVSRAPHYGEVQSIFGPVNPQRDAWKYVTRDKPVPPGIVLALLEELKPKKGGRHSHPEQWAAERANAISCYLAMERLLTVEPTLSQTAAGIRIGKLRGRSCAAVVRCWKNMKNSA